MFDTVQVKEGKDYLLYRGTLKPPLEVMVLTLYKIEKVTVLKLPASERKKSVFFY